MNENVKSCLAGGAGGMASVFTGHPFDTMKVKIQCNPTKMTMTQCFKTIMKESGERIKKVVRYQNQDFFRSAWVLSWNGNATSPCHPSF